MGHIRAKPDQGVRWDNVAAHFIICQRFAVEANSRWIQPQRLLQYHAGVGKSGEVLNRGEPATEYLLQFCMQAILGVGVLGKQVPRPGERVRERWNMDRLKPRGSR